MSSSSSAETSDRGHGQDVTEHTKQDGISFIKENILLKHLTEECTFRIGISFNQRIQHSILNEKFYGLCWAAGMVL